MWLRNKSSKSKTCCNRKDPGKVLQRVILIALQPVWQCSGRLRSSKILRIS